MFYLVLSYNLKVQSANISKELVSSCAMNGNEGFFAKRGIEAVETTPFTFKNNQKMILNCLWNKLLWVHKKSPSVSTQPCITPKWRCSQGRSFLNSDLNIPNKSETNNIHPRLQGGNGLGHFMCTSLKVIYL